jgi:hypothetical protein
MTRSFRERGLGEVDSCTAPGQQPVSRLWPERRELIDCRVALGGALRGHVFAGILACEALRAGHDARRDGGSSHKP